MSFIPDSLVYAIKSGNCVIFVGAGISQAAGLPGWQKLMEMIASSCNVDFEADLRKLAGKIENKIGRQRLIEELRKHLPFKRPTDLHHLLTSLPVNDWVTTNYDDLLERTFGHDGIAYTTLFNPQQLGFKSLKYVKQILKLHGDFNNPTNIIITEDDYVRHYTKSSLILNTFELLRAQNTFLYLGYSMRDPELNFIISHVESQLGNVTHPMFAVFFDDESVQQASSMELKKATIIDGRPLPGETINEKSEIFVKTLKKRTEEQKRVFVVADFKNWFEEKEILEKFKERYIDAVNNRDWPLGDNFEEWKYRSIKNAQILFVLPPDFPGKENDWLKKQVLTGIGEGCRIVFLNQNGQPSPMEYYFQLSGREKEVFKTFIEEDKMAVEDLIKKYQLQASISDQEYRTTGASAAKRAIDELLAKASILNRDIPSDLIADRMFISNQAAVCIVKAWEIAENNDLDLYDSTRLKVELEYARLVRFQGKWDKASERLHHILNFNPALLEELREFHIQFLAESGALDFEMGRAAKPYQVDKAFRIVETNELNMDAVKMLKLLGNLYRELGEWNLVERYLLSARYLADSLRRGTSPLKQQADFDPTLDILWLDCRREYAGFLMQQNKFSEAEAELKAIVDYILKSPHKDLMDYFLGFTKYTFGQLQARMGKPRPALVTLWESLEILQKYDNPVRIAFVLDWIGRAMSQHRPLLDPEVAENYIRKAKKLRQKCGHEYFEAYTDLALGNLYLQREQIEDAKKFYKEARRHFIKLQKMRSVGMAEFLLGIAESKTNPRNEINQEKAEQHFREAIKIFSQIGYEPMIREAKFEILRLKGAIDKRLEETMEEAKKEGYILHLNEVGEYKFHTWIKEYIDRENLAFPLISFEIDIGVGDDAAVLNIPKDYEIVLTTDAAPGSICRSHETEDGRYAAKFSVIHSISDLLAMGATPIAVLLNLYLDRDATVPYAQEVIKVVAKEARSYGAALVGGDIKERKEQSVGCVGIGLVRIGQAIRRNGARARQIVAISLAGMRDNGSINRRRGIRKIGKRWAADVLENIEYKGNPELKEYLDRYRRDNIKQNLLFLSLNEMIEGAKTKKIKAAIDTSDGFMSCLQLLGRESGVDFVLEDELIEAIIDDEVKDIAKKIEIHCGQFLFNAGHDWEIVMTIEEADFAEVQRAFISAGGYLAPLGRAIDKNGQFQREIGIRDKKGNIRKIPIFTDEKFVRRSYEERISEWDDINVNYYLENGEIVELDYKPIPKDFAIQN